MSNVSPEIRAQQLAYAARPFAVRWVDSHYSGTSRFNTLDDAYAYIERVWGNVQKMVVDPRYGNSWRASQLWQSYLETPTGRVQLAYVMLCDDVRSRKVLS